MKWSTWNLIESAVLEAGIRPLVAVVPDNRDPHLVAGEANPDFWERVRTWLTWGWTLGIHGYQHAFTTRNRGILGINRMSEFAGLPRDEQATKIERALAIFRREGTEPTVWVAPAHSFDRTTGDVLREQGIRIVSDGFFVRPFIDRTGMVWVPQQMWRFRPMPMGTWTVCIHPNAWTEREAGRFLDGIAKYRDRITDVDTIVNGCRRKGPSLGDRLTSHVLLPSIQVKRVLRRVRAPRRPRTGAARGAAAQ